MPIAIDPERAHRFILPDERGNACPTVFLLRPLSGPDAKLAMRITPNTDNAELIYDIATICLAGWESFCTSDGAAVAFETEERVVLGKKRVVPKDSTMRRLDATTIGELALAATDMSRLTIVEAKN